MGDDDAPTRMVAMQGGGAHGKSPARKVPRPRPFIKRRSLVGGSAGAGDSTPRVLVPGDTKDKDMAASFLQYCAMCERQISHPSNSILYCSEACRRKDSAKPLSASAMSISSPPTSPLALAPSTTPMRGGVKSSSSPDYFVGSSRIPTDIHHFKSDLDPTEWKPKLPYRASGASEAFLYLSRFHDTMIAGDTADRDNHPLHQNMRHKSTTSLSTLPTTATTTPSLGNTPTTTASTSFDSRYEYDFSFNLRPLPPRQNPMYSASTSQVKGIDLVTPHIPPPAIATTAAAATATTNGGGGAAAAVEVHVAAASSSSVPSSMSISASTGYNYTYNQDFVLGKKNVVVRGNTPCAVNGDGLGALFAQEK
ncbi:hypothetical protein RBB50_004301 [Rhinocladiella similis]